MRSFNPDKALELSGYNGKFKKSLKLILNRLSKDSSVEDLRVSAYILATAKVESDYSLQRWEADYVCGDIGVPYEDKPCQSAINYYCSNQGGKANYCNSENLDKRNLPYFGRGAIQLTWKENYKTYGDIIGVDLVNNPEKALDPVVSYKVLVAYINKRTKKYIESNDWNAARKSVNGCSTCDLSKIQQSYDMWLSILKKAKVVQLEKSKKRKVIVSVLVLTAFMFLTVFVIYKSTKEK